MKCVVGLVPGGKTYAFEGWFDALYAVSDDPLKIIGEPIPIVMFTDIACLFNVVLTGSRNAEKRLMIDLAATKYSQFV